MVEAIVSIGSNIGSKLDNLNAAIKSLGMIPKTSISKISRFYETEPFGVTDVQDKFINCCARLSTELSADTLLGICFGIESAMGRKREYRFSPRIIDIDLLLYDNDKYNTKNLIIPHPRILERAFVMVPLDDVCEDQKFHYFNFSNELNGIDKSGVKLVKP